MTNLFRLSSEQGQSPWLDNLKRSYITSGELQAWIDAGIRGLTSNPTIFQKAIQGSTDYDDQFRDLVGARSSVADAYWEMVAADIRGALDAFEPLYRSSNGADGFVSVEVDPNLALDSDGTLTAGRELWTRIARPNLMIKIPATSEGLPAIRSMIAEGRNVNVTLIFALDRYQNVMDAYLDGLEDRRRSGGSVAGIASVASFFISRVDTEIDRRLEEVGSPSALALRGRAAVAQARLAYDAFRRTFSGPRWENLRAAGAAVQRPLWASTSTKNPAYPDTLYVDELIGPDTVNTLPDSTVTAFLDHGTVARTIDIDIDEARATWAALGQIIDLDDVATRLEREGVTAFQKSFDELLGALEAKSAEF